MKESLSARIAQIAWRHGFSGAEVALFAGGLNLARSMGLSLSQSPSLRGLLADVGDRLEPLSEWDALTAAADWLRHPSMPEAMLARLEESVEAVLDVAADIPDWNDELGAVIEAVGYRGLFLSMPLPTARAFLNVLDLPASGDCVCAFGASASLAWSLSETRPVRLYAGEPDVARLFAMFAAAAGRDLVVDRRNPLDGSFLPTLSDTELRDRSPMTEADYIVSIPPFGLRIRDIDGGLVPVEALQVDRLRRFARREFLTVVPEGFLFRDGRRETQIRRELVETCKVEVDSLPAGVFGRASGVLSALLRISAGHEGSVRFVDGRTMPAQSSGKVQERLLLQHLASWPEVRNDEERSASPSIDTLAENNFVLVPERYVRPTALQTIQEAAAELPHVALTDVAMIERSKAPRPLHDAEEQPALVCREIAPSDINEGIVAEPRRTVNFSEDEAKRARSVAVSAGDIVVSIKGNVGIVGIVPVSAPDADSDEPWIISQSLAIVRYRTNSHVPSAEMLNAILTAPWVRHSLERLAAGSTVRSLSMGDLRQLQIPLLTAREFEAVGKVLGMVAETREEIRALVEKVASSQRRIWTKLWGMNPDEQDDALYA